MNNFHHHLIENNSISMGTYSASPWYPKSKNPSTLAYLSKSMLFNKDELMSLSFTPSPILPGRLSSLNF